MKKSSFKKAGSDASKKVGLIYNSVPILGVKLKANSQIPAEDVSSTNGRRKKPLNYLCLRFKRITRYIP